MKLSQEQKLKIKEKLKKSLILENEIEKIVIFGSFLNSNNPNDIDIAVFQNSDESYLELALKYRRKTRTVSNTIPLDIFPIKPNAAHHFFLKKILAGEVIYEK